MHLFSSRVCKAIKIFNATRVITEGMVRFFNAGTQVLNAWTPTNTNTDIPRAISAIQIKMPVHQPVF